MNNYTKLVFTILIFCSCFGFVFIPEQTMILSVPLLLYYTIKDKKWGETFFSKAIILFYLFITIGLFTCFYYRGQTPLQTMQTTYWVGFNGILIYYFMKYKKLDTYKVENIISILYLVFCICYLIQYLIYPFHLFRTLASDDGSRFRMVGQLVLSLGFFYELNCYINNSRKKHLFYSFLGMVIFILLGFRSLFAALIICIIILLIKRYGFSKKFMKYVVIGGVCAVFIMFLPFTQNTIKAMIERQKTDNFKNEDYIRIRQLDYYMNDHFKNHTEYVLGSGIPKHGTKYGNSIEVSAENYGSNVYGWVDWGFLGLSWIIGIPAVMCLILIFLKSIFLKVPQDTIYIQVWYIFLLLVGFTTIEAFRTGSFIFHGIAIYIIEKRNLLVKKQNKECIQS